MNRQDVLYSLFSRPDTEKVLSELSDETDVFKIRKRLSADFVDDASLFLTDLILLRKKAKKKFSLASKMIFDKEGCEQATHPVVAKYHASLASSDDRVFEICTGIGIDTSFFSKTAKKVISIDSSKEKIYMAKHNANILGNIRNIQFKEVSFEECETADNCSFIYADPSRRNNQKRIYDPEECFPSVSSILSFSEKSEIEDGKCVIKLSPICDYESLLGYGRIEVVSYKREVREILFIRDSKRKGEVSAIILFDDQGPNKIGKSNKEMLFTDSIKNYIVEADPAVIKAGALNEIASKISAAKVHPELDYLTTNNFTFDNAVRFFKVKRVSPFKEKRIKRYLKEQEITKASVKTRGIKKTPEVISRELGLKGGDNRLFIFVFRCGKKRVCAVTEEVFSSHE